MLGLALTFWVAPAATGAPPPTFIPSLDFTDARNSQFAVVLGL